MVDTAVQVRDTCHGMDARLIECSFGGVTTLDKRDRLRGFRLRSVSVNLLNSEFVPVFFQMSSGIWTHFLFLKAFSRHDVWRERVAI